MRPAAAPTGARSLRSRQLVAAALLVALALGALAAAFVAFEWRDIRRSQLSELALYARALDDQTASMVSSADSILRAIATAVEQPAATGGNAAIAALLQDSLRGRPFFRSVSWLDAQGQVVASSNSANRGLKLPVALLGAAKLPDAVSWLAPLASGRDLGDLGQVPLSQARVLALPLVLALNTPARAGYLVALINPDQIETQFDRAIDGKPLRALLIGLNGQLMVATSGSSVAPGTSLLTLPAYTEFLPAREFGTGVGAGSEGGTVLSAFRVTRNWPLVVQVEQPYAVFLSEVAQAAEWALAFVLSGWLLLGVGTVGARRALLRDERLNRDLRVAHAATQASESRKLAILQSSLDAIVTVDTQGAVIEFNAAAEQMFGHAAAQVLGLPMHELIVPAHHRAAHQAGMARYLSTGVAHVLNRRIEVEALRADGSLFQAELTIVPVQTEQGEIFTATLRDITERLRSEQERASLLQRYRETAVELERQRLALDQHAIVSVADAEGTIVYANSRLCAVSGYSLDELLGRRHSVLARPDDHAQTRPQQWTAQGETALGPEVRERLLAGKIWEGELVHRRKDGSRFWAASTLVPMLDGTGRLQQLFMIQTDITARVQAEQELARSRDRELQVGARIQQSLLMTAPPPDIDGLQISSHNQASQGIDGDFVEVIRVGPHCVDLIAGDVMGKGLAAAMMGAATKLQFSRSIAELLTLSGRGDELPQPAAVVAAVHRAMTPALQALEAFVTLCYLRIDTQRNRITWVGCGHEETLHVGAGGACVLLANQHPPLGVLDDADYAQDEREMAPGDALFLCSDGVTDAMRPDGERVGRDRVTQAAIHRLTAHATPAAALHAMRVDLLVQGVQLQDDVTMVVVQRQPTGTCSTRVELPVALQALRQVRAFVNTQTAAAGLDEGARGLLEVACVEAFTNIVRHGGALIEGAPVELVARREPGVLVIELVHLGIEFTPPAEALATDFDAYPEGGFGLQIIHGANDSVSYLHDAGVNTIRMTKRLA